MEIQINARVNSQIILLIYPSFDNKSKDISAKKYIDKKKKYNISLFFLHIYCVLILIVVNTSDKCNAV